MPLAYHPRAYLLALTLPLLTLLIALIYAHSAPNLHNPYSRYLDYSPAEIRALASCYVSHDMGMYDTSRYCVLDSVDSFIVFSFLQNGDVSSVSFWRGLPTLQVGDFYNFYGVPTLIRSTKYWTNTTFMTDEYLIYVSARYDNLYARVRYVWVSVR